MELQFCGNTSPHNPSGGLCDEYRVSAIASLEDWIAAYQQIGAAHPGCRALLSLDDLGQARYTSMHARQSIGLDEVSEEDLAGLPPECFEDGEYASFMSTKAEFAICARNLSALAAGVTFQDACAHGLTLDAQGLQEWLGYQQQPLSLFDQPLSALVVPVAHGHEALAGFPNGYFSSDLGPLHNVAVARHLAQAHGYELVGVGAAYLGFLRATAADLQSARAVAADFCALYNSADAALIEVVSQAIVGRVHLWLRYVE